VIRRWHGCAAGPRIFKVCDPHRPGQARRPFRQLSRDSTRSSASADTDRAESRGRGVPTMTGEVATVECSLQAVPVENLAKEELRPTAPRTRSAARRSALSTACTHTPRLRARNSPSPCRGFSPFRHIPARLRVPLI